MIPEQTATFPANQDFHDGGSTASASMFPFQSPLWKPAAWLAFCALGLDLLLAAPSAPPTAVLWQQVLDDDVSDRRDPEPGDPSAQLATAFAHMQREPRTAANFARAAALLRPLAADPAAPLESSLMAEFLLGRIAHLYRYPPDPATAAIHYRAVLERAPDAPFAQHVAVRHLIAQLTSAPDAATARAHWTAGVALVTTFTDPDAQRDGHFTLFRLGLYWEIGDSVLLPHGIAAARQPFHQPQNRFNLDLAIANVAARDGQIELAREFYTRLLASPQRSVKRDLIADRLAALPPAATTPAADPAP